MRAWRAAYLAILAAVSLGAAPAAAQADAEVYEVGTALVAEIDGGIGPATTLLVEHAIERASAEPGGMLVLRTDTPGGLDSATRDIVAAILASPVPVVTWVGPSGARAASAGTYILYASHVAAMAESTSLGAATPVQMGGGGDDDAMKRKRVNDSVAFIRGLAELRGRDIGFAERAVRDAATLTAVDAIQDGVVEILANDVERVVAQADGLAVRLGETRVRLDTERASIAVHEPNFLTRTLALITDPNIAYLFLLIGIYGIIFEFANPGLIFSGVLGVISLVIGLYAMNLLPIDVTGVLLVVLGVALMVAEALAPSFGILGIGGAAAFAFGSFILFETDTPGFRLSPVVVLAATASTVGILVFLLAASVRALRRPSASGDRALATETGRVLSWDAFTGEIEIHGERWLARADAPLATGERVRVSSRDGLVLFVERAADAVHPPSEPPTRRSPSPSP